MHLKKLYATNEDDGKHKAEARNGIEGVKFSPHSTAGGLGAELGHLRGQEGNESRGWAILKQGSTGLEKASLKSTGQRKTQANTSLTERGGYLEDISYDWGLQAGYWASSSRNFYKKCWSVFRVTGDMSPTRIDRLGMLEIGEEVTQSFFFFNLIKLISLRLSGPRDTYFKIMQLSKFFFYQLLLKTKAGSSEDVSIVSGKTSKSRDPSLRLEN